MTQRFFVSSVGAYLGSFDGADEDMPDDLKAGVPVPTPPEDGRQVWDASKRKFLPLPPDPYKISKTTPWLRMTAEEASIMDGVMTQTDAQMRQVYMAAQYLSSGDEFWPTLHQLLADNLPGGSARADELLAPEG
ncbi:hypothetical protein [Agrobacterium larrymoorei]|uniref:hypothetical protein n=1 Tax=Agrobacterium larrymoorei TaxID=160699 RepID=UPI0030BC601C